MGEAGGETGGEAGRGGGGGKRVITAGVSHFHVFSWKALYASREKRIVQLSTTVSRGNKCKSY